MPNHHPDNLIAELRRVTPVRRFGRIIGIDAAGLKITGLLRHACLGDQLSIESAGAGRVDGEVIALNESHLIASTYSPSDGLAIGDMAELVHLDVIRPHESWQGRVIDAFARPIDGKPLRGGSTAMKLKNLPPVALGRKQFGARLRTGLAVFDTLLPLARGQRLGIFAGSGVGKTTLLGQLARGVAADIVILALIGERGRELRDFTENVLGSEGLARSVLVVATSDQSPLVKRRAAWTAMAVAEYFRDHGKHVLLIVDSLTRFAEAHREIALAAGEKPSLSAYPPSTANLISSFAERSGPGGPRQGDITAIMSVLVAGSDMEEPVADMVRGTLDGHIVLERSIAERGRFPAVDVRRSVSRSLPSIATTEENALLAEARFLLGTYYDAEVLIHSGLYSSGSNPEIDRAVRLWPMLDSFFARSVDGAVEQSFGYLREILAEI